MSTPYLQHCANPGCRALLLSSDVRCPHCGQERVSFKVFRFWWWMTTRVLLPVGIVVLSYYLYVESEHRREREREEKQAHQAHLFLPQNVIAND